MPDTFTVRDLSSIAFPRDLYTQYLLAELCAASNAHGPSGASRPDARLALLSEAEAPVVAFLLDELDGAYGSDALATRLTDRLGV